VVRIEPRPKVDIMDFLHMEAQNQLGELALGTRQEPRLAEWFHRDCGGVLPALEYRVISIPSPSPATRQVIPEEFLALYKECDAPLSHLDLVSQTLLSTTHPYVDVLLHIGRALTMPVPVVEGITACQLHIPTQRWETVCLAVVPVLVKRLILALFSTAKGKKAVLEMHVQAYGKEESANFAFYMRVAEGGFGVRRFITASSSSSFSPSSPPSVAQ